MCFSPFKILRKPFISHPTGVSIQPEQPCSPSHLVQHPQDAKQAPAPSDIQPPFLMTYDNTVYMNTIYLLLNMSFQEYAMIDAVR